MQALYDARDDPEPNIGSLMMNSRERFRTTLRSVTVRTDAVSDMLWLHFPVTVHDLDVISPQRIIQPVTCP